MYYDFEALRLLRTSGVIPCIMPAMWFQPQVPDKLQCIFCKGIHSYWKDISLLHCCSQALNFNLVLTLLFKRPDFFFFQPAFAYLLFLNYSLLRLCSLIAKSSGVRTFPSQHFPGTVVSFPCPFLAGGWCSMLCTGEDSTISNNLVTHSWLPCNIPESSLFENRVPELDIAVLVPSVIHTCNIMASCIIVQVLH